MRFLQAQKVFNGQMFLNESTILVLDSDNKFVEFTNLNEVSTQPIELFEGIICPGFINAHCHLELSHFLGQVPQHTGLVEFAKHLIKLRPHFPNELALASMLEADEHMYKNGIVAVGDICNDASSFKVKQNSSIYYHSFIELIGLNPDLATPIFEKGKALYEQLNQFRFIGSLAPHAPYSVSNQLIQLISEFNQHKKLSGTIHNQESIEETKFMMGEKSAFDALYEFLNLDISWFQAPKTSSVKSFYPYLNKQNWLLVHNTFSSTTDICYAGNDHVFWCFCPNANRYIENTLPKFDSFSNLTNQICIGTDSLASNQQLDMISEMNLIKKNSSLSPETILQAATYNGARALGIEHLFGKMIPNKNAGLNLIELKNNEFKFLQKIA